jgi:hypothetical protein
MPATADNFRPYPNSVFIETGTWHGDGIQAALDAGFREVRSIELSPALHQQARTRFARRPEVKLWLGSSGEVLRDVIADVTEPATFWLDAHYSGGDSMLGPEACPVLLELAILAEHPVKTHTLLIDDVRCFGSTYSVDVESVRRAISAINPAYRMSFDRSGWPQLGLDILVAVVGPA